MRFIQQFAAFVKVPFRTCHGQLPGKVVIQVPGMKHMVVGVGGDDGGTEGEHLIHEGYEEQVIERHLSQGGHCSHLGHEFLVVVLPGLFAHPCLE